jgi:hypothetical protein
METPRSAATAGTTELVRVAIEGLIVAPGAPSESATKTRVSEDFSLPRAYFLTITAIGT